MPSRNVAVQKLVYDRLVQEKRGGESFTALFRRLLEQKGGLEEVAGSWGKVRSKKDRLRLRSLRGARRLS